MEAMLTNEDYRVNLDIFEGPLDLLLYLIKKNDLDVYDIPIAFVLEEYMRYIDTLRVLNIDMAGEFLLMAADLAYIKSRMLLPEDKVEGDEEEEFDPRADLVRRLLEYQQYRDAAESLEQRTQLGRDVFVPQERQQIETDQERPLEAHVYDLIEAFGKVLKRIPAEQYHQVAFDRMSVNSCIYQLVEKVKKDATITLEELLEGNRDRYHVVVVFLALLEMSRLKMIKVYQSEQYGSLYVRGAMESIEQQDALKLVQTDWGGEEKSDGAQ